MPRRSAGKMKVSLSLYFAGDYKKLDMLIIYTEMTSVVAYCNDNYLTTIAKYYTEIVYWVFIRGNAITSE